MTKIKTSFHNNDRASEQAALQHLLFKETITPADIDSVNVAVGSNIIDTLVKTKTITRYEAKEARKIGENYASQQESEGRKRFPLKGLPFIRQLT